MNDRSKSEYEQFSKNFEKYKDKKIVLYGIGRGTVNFLSANDKFNIVGLMDREEDNIGKEMFGLPILSLEKAEEKGDLIIISAPETYWEMIYLRIIHSKIPVYYRNGNKACINTREEKSRQTIRQELDNIVSNKEEGKIVELLWDKLIGTESEGKIKISNFETYGYCIWGSIIFSFCFWLVSQCKEMKIDKLLFLSRDGYFLHKHFEYYQSMLQGQDYVQSKYVYSSRRIAYTSSIESETDLEEWKCFPYNGLFKDYMWSRFMISVDEDVNRDVFIQMPYDRDKVNKWIMPYMDSINRNLQADKKNYLKYLDSLDIDDKTAIVDIGYSGTIQNKMSKLLKRKMIGLYFVCDLSPLNKCLAENVMKPCFQKAGDLDASQTGIYRKPQLLESLFTAPYGMVMSVNEYGIKICMESANNQKGFVEREEINNGILYFLQDCKNIMPDNSRQFCIFCDYLYEYMSLVTDISDDIKNIFYWDDNLVQTRENRILV